MEFGKILVEIEGTKPLLMNRLTVESLKENDVCGPNKTFDPEEEAAKKAYIDVIDGKRQLYIPNDCIYKNLILASKPYKVSYKNTKKKISLASIISGAIRIEPEKIPLGTDKYTIDERPVNIKAAGNRRVLRWRPRIDEWKVQFYIIYMKKFLGNELAIASLKEALEDGGVRFGLLDNRPERGGKFGTFIVTKFEVIE